MDRKTDSPIMDGVSRLRLSCLMLSCSGSQVHLSNDRPMIQRQVRKAAIILANGYILFFFSERVFWSFWRPGDNLSELLVTWIAYCLLGWIFLDLVRRFKVASFSSLFLCGAVFGWVGEGVVVDTLYGDPTNPFPLSVSWTGLAWHALLSVGVGWYLIGRALTDEKPTKIALISLAVGVSWGLWAVWWQKELGKDVDTSVLGFASHALPCSIPFLLAWFVLGLAQPHWFQSGRVATIVLWGLVLAVFLVARVPTRPYAALILPPLLLTCIVGLHRNARREQRPDVLDGILDRIRTRNVLVLILIPVSAIAVYALFHSLNLQVPTNVMLYVITMPLGFWFFFRSLWFTIRPRNA
jgi:hypothetical protein